MVGVVRLLDGEVQAAAALQLRDHGRDHRHADLDCRPRRLGVHVLGGKWQILDLSVYIDLQINLTIQLLATADLVFKLVF